MFDSDETTWQGVLQALDQNAERYLIYVAYTYLIFIVIAEVLRRFLIDFSSLWGASTARFMFIYLTYIGMSWAAYKRIHIRIDVIYEYVSERVRDYLYLFSDLAMLVFAVISIQFTLPIIRTSIQYGSKTQALRINRAFVQFAVLLGFAMFTIRVLQRTYQDVQDIRHDRPVFTGESIFLEEE